MRDLWLKLGCFLTGYNYTIIKNSSEASAKSVKKYLSALLIVSIIWCFIGFTFSNRYLHAGLLGSVCVAIVMVIIVIQIERQIILTTGPSNWALVFRGLIAIVMAVVGSIIIDQIIFKEDIEIQKISKVQEDVNKILSTKTTQLDMEIGSLDTLIMKKEQERAVLIDEITRKPFVKSSISERKNHIVKINGPNGTSRDSVIVRTDLTLTDAVNPKAGLIATVDQLIADLRIQKTEKQKARINIRQDLENDLKSKTGFLDEMNTLISILISHTVALIVWILIFVFFLSLEIFVLVIKFGDSKNDYEKAILYQMNSRILMIDELANQYSKTIIK
jgi:hypothetical protein